MYLKIYNEGRDSNNVFMIVTPKYDKHVNCNKHAVFAKRKQNIGKKYLVSCLLFKTLAILPSQCQIKAEKESRMDPAVPRTAVSFSLTRGGDHHW